MFFGEADLLLDRLADEPTELSNQGFAISQVEAEDSPAVVAIERAGYAGPL